MTEVAGWRVLLTASGLATALVLGFLVITPLPYAESVQSAWHSMDSLWRDSISKQITGFSLLGISLLALTLSLRKRWDWFRLGGYGIWRSLHGVLGVLTLLGFLIHTGLHLGSNFTFALAVVFLALNLLGSITGVAAALESKLQGQYSRAIRFCRPLLAQLHIWLFWPLPVLILFHVISVYYY